LHHLMFADKKMSQGEPCVICVSNVLDEAELTLMMQLFAFSNDCVMLAITLVMLDAAKTMSVGFLAEKAPLYAK